jgi:hypothetical protein
MLLGSVMANFNLCMTKRSKNVAQHSDVEEPRCLHTSQSHDQTLSTQKSSKNVLELQLTSSFV